MNTNPERDFDNIPQNSLTNSIFPDTPLPTVNDVLAKIIEFSNSLNSSYRLALLNCSLAERHSSIYSLITLKKSIKCTLEELGKSLRNRSYQFRCGSCNEEIVIQPNEDIWNALQNHEHFEELYYQFLNNKLDIRPIAEESPIPVGLERENHFITEDTNTAGDSNTDSGIEQQEMDPSTSGTPKETSIVTPTDENINNFRFNFNANYDEHIESKIYPANIMLMVRKYDKVKNYSVLRAGYNKAACLLCQCELNGTRISKHALVNHAMGQKHLKAASHEPTLAVLQYFHDFWLKQELPIQAHQVYFRPKSLQSMKCAMCCLVCHANEIIPHILNAPHARKVLEMYERRINLYLLINLQVQVYGITEEQIEAREKEYMLKEEAKDKERKHAKQSDSDTADEAKQLPKTPQGVEHNIVKSVENSESTNPIDHLPNRMKDQIQFFRLIAKPHSTPSTSVQCTLCKMFIGCNINDLKFHIISTPLHQKKDKYKFYCEICNIKANNELEWLKHDFSNSRHTNIAASRKERVTEYECTKCKTVIFGDEISLIRHRGVGSRGNRRERGTRLPEPIKKLLQSREHILEHVNVLTKSAKDVLVDSQTQDCCLSLELALCEVFENCKVYPFGSRISGIGNKASDLDVFVDIEGTYYGDKNQDPRDQVLTIKRAAKAFSKKKDDYCNILPVLTARTPILRLHHVPTKIDCDLSFKHGLSVENTKFLKFCMELQPVCQQLILLIKEWAKYIDFEGVTTYALAILCIFYMQVNGYLLSVVKLREINQVETASINGWKIINYVLSVDETKPQVKPYDNTALELLQEFFKYYSKFDFNSYVVCPLLGRVVNRSLFSEGNPEDLPAEMDTYVTQLETEDAEIFKSTSYMCIQDPFDLSHNLTKATQQGTVTKFQTMCKLSLAHIEALK